MELEPEVINAIRQITDRFIRLGEFTPVHEIKSKLGAKRRALEGLAHDRIIQDFGENYAPSLRGVTEFEDDDTQKMCLGYTEIVLKALKRLYGQEGQKDYTREQVTDTVARMMEIPAESEAIRIGMFFATEFSDYSGTWVGIAAPQGVYSIRVMEGILDFDTIRPAWQNELLKRNAAASRGTLAGETAERRGDPADLNSRKEDWDKRPSAAAKSSEKVREAARNRTDVFVVHGHDRGMKETVARFLAKLGLNPIILHEQPDHGRTVIEKFEEHARVSFAIAVFSGDDLGISKEEISRIPSGMTLQQSMHPRARQNVVFEFGYFVGRIGRGNVVAIIESGVETMSDYAGVLYIPFDAEGAWRLKLVKELKAAGLDVDANAAL